MPRRRRPVLILSPQATSALVRHARRQAPEESVGLLAGRGRHAIVYLPLPNESPDPTRSFFTCARHLAQALAWVQRQGWTPLALCHSHPSGSLSPSARDREGAGSSLPTLVVVPCSLPRLRLYLPRPGGFGSLPVWVAGTGQRPPSPPASLYARQMALPEIGREGQRRLAAASVLVVGLGGLGTPVALYLARAGVGTLGLSDPDQVEPHNLHRQILYLPQDVGRSKVEAAQKRLKELAPRLKLRVEPPLDRHSACQVVGRYDVVVHASDRLFVRDALNAACLAAGVPWVDASVHRWTLQVTTYVPHGPCYRCVFPQLPPEEEPCDVAGIAGPVTATAAGLQAVEVLKLVLGRGESLAGRLLVWDLLSGRSVTVRTHRLPGCPVCAHEPMRPRASMPSAADPVALARALGLSLAPHQLAGWQGPIVDVRPPTAYQLYHLPGSVSLPGATPQDVLSRFGGGPPPLLVCARGVASARLALALARDLPGVRTLEGGMQALQEDSGEGTWSGEAVPR